MKLAVLRPHRKYGSSIFAKPNIQETFSEISENNNVITVNGMVEVLTVDLGKYAVTSVYKPSNFTFNNVETKIMFGYFNCHSQN